MWGTRHWLADRAQKPAHSSDLHSKDGSYFVERTRGRLPEDDASRDNHTNLCSGTRESNLRLRNAIKTRVAPLSEEVV